MAQLKIDNLTRTRIPTAPGEFQLYYYQNNQDDKEHLALVMGDVRENPNVLVRIHSECFTGDVLGSLRCDCGPQLAKAMQTIAEEGAGVIVYLRQEGRGIGLLDKLRAYNLQDQGYDTVEANLMLGHQADARDYSIAAKILQDLGIQSLRLMTNNPDKIEGLEALGVAVADRVPILTGQHAENEGYLRTKVERMRHLMNLNVHVNGNGNGHSNGHHYTPALVEASAVKRPFVTLTYAQSLDGSIAYKQGESFPISGKESMTMTHRLRTEHDAILVGIGTLLADNPRLTARLVEGNHPRPIILDSNLRTPPDARVFENQSHQPWIFCSTHADVKGKVALEVAGATVTAVSKMENGDLDLSEVLTHLYDANLNTLMVEGGASIISSFLSSQLVDRIILTIAPIFLGGVTAVNAQLPKLPRLQHVEQSHMGNDLIIKGDVVWDNNIVL